MFNTPCLSFTGGTRRLLASQLVFTLSEFRPLYGSRNKCNEWDSVTNTFRKTGLHNRKLPGKEVSFHFSLAMTFVIAQVSTA
jgi:hypothetical protein